MDDVVGCRGEILYETCADDDARCAMGKRFVYGDVGCGFLVRLNH